MTVTALPSSSSTSPGITSIASTGPAIALGGGVGKVAEQGLKSAGTGTQSGRADHRVRRGKRLAGIADQVRHAHPWVAG